MHAPQVTYIILSYNFLTFIISSYPVVYYGIYATNATCNYVMLFCSIVFLSLKTYCLESFFYDSYFFQKQLYASLTEQQISFGFLLFGLL